ncbi:Myosin-binding protein-related [Schistosoma japonicum]|uniref:Myosin-binding protein-related n=1 Tax=Schistosoma japonicum TaxID=6182 RepID=A0A4Z2D8R5_SCHJA|nr:Myosin-binding protein-related [Schistosoma japonicum]
MLVTEVGDTVTEKADEVIVQEGKESLSQTMDWVSEGVDELEGFDHPDNVYVVEQPSEIGLAVSGRPIEVNTLEEVLVKEAVVDKVPVEVETVPVSVVSEGAVEVTDVESTVAVMEESGTVAEQETLVVEQLVESKTMATVKKDERVVQEMEKEPVPETIDWVSEDVVELKESDSPDSARVVEEPSEIGVAVPERRVEMETTELIPVREAVVDETPVETETVSVSVVSEREVEVASERSMAAVTEDFPMEVEQVTVTVDEVSSRVESVTSSTEERVVSEAVGLEEAVYDVGEVKQVKAETRATTDDAADSGVVTSTMPSLSDVVSVEEVPSEASYLYVHKHSAQP